MPWLPLSRVGSTKHEVPLWLCRCDACGAERVMSRWAATKRPPACQGCKARARSIGLEAAELVERFYGFAKKRAWMFFRGLSKHPDEADVVDAAHDALMATASKWTGGSAGRFGALVAGQVRWKALSVARRRTRRARLDKRRGFGGGRDRIEVEAGIP